MSRLSTLAAQFLPVALALIAALIGGRWPIREGGRIERWGTGAWAPWLVGMMSAAAFGIVWGSLSPVATIHDEAAYLLQARLLATGRLVGPGRPLPEFFEQFQTFVTPVVAAKYPLGFPLALVPGIWLGMPALMPLLLNGIAGGLFFALTRRLASPSVAALAWLIWLLAPGTILYHASYLSEILSGPLWLAAWWCLLEWSKTGSWKWLTGLSITIAACAITRPLTAVGLALPCAAVVLTGVWRRRQWLQLAIAATAGAMVLSPLFYQNVRVTGHWSMTPWERYADVYAPVDRPGFTIDTRPPERPIPKDMQDYIVAFTAAHVGFEPSRLPVILAARLEQIFRDAWREWVPSLALLALIGLVTGGRELQFGMACAGSLVIVHLIFAHPLNWSLYYQEGQPALAAATALGIGWVIAFVTRRARRQETIASSWRPVLAVWLTVACAAAIGTAVVPEARERHEKVAAFHEHFRELIDTLPGPAIVFVRYTQIHPFWKSLIDNPPDLDHARNWVVRDRGTDNARLTALAPGRLPYLFLERGNLLEPLTAGGDSILRQPPVP